MNFCEEVTKLPNWRWIDKLPTLCGRYFISFTGAHSDCSNNQCVLASCGLSPEYFWVKTKDVAPDLAQIPTSTIEMLVNRSHYDCHIWLMKCEGNFEIRFCTGKDRTKTPVEIIGTYSDRSEAIYEMFKFASTIPEIRKDLIISET